MWKNRGEPQLLKPLNASNQGSDGIPFISLLSEEITFQGYDINKEGRPIFNYSSPKGSWSDEIKPIEEGKRLSRSIKLSGTSSGLDFQIAKSSNISKLPNGLFSVNGQYYVDAPNAVIDNGKLILRSDANGTVYYELFW
jgi:hypothetical protein